ncbi:MAG: YceI family protein, partial [Christiangramia sp.]
IDHVELISPEYQKAFITVKLAGKTNHYNLPVMINEDRFKGKFKMNIRDFGLEPPKKALGLIEVDEQIEVQFDLKVSR